MSLFVRAMMRNNEDVKRIKQLAAQLRYRKKMNDDGPQLDAIAKEFVMRVDRVKHLYHDYFIVPAIFTYALEVLDELV